MAWGARNLISTQVVTSTGATGAATREPFAAFFLPPRASTAATRASSVPPSLALGSSLEAGTSLGAGVTACVSLLSAGGGAAASSAAAAAGLKYASVRAKPLSPPRRRRGPRPPPRWPADS